MTMDSPLPVKEDKKDLEYERLQNLYPAGIRDVMLYRHGYVPIFALRPGAPQDRIATPRPDNKYYPMVETAKRNKILYDERDRQRQLARVNDIHPRPEWRPPQPVTKLPRVNGPSYIRQFNNLMRPFPFQRRY
jgi:hypothetical protein